MKKYILTLFILAISTNSIFAQSFMRYHMHDGSFNGFYTNCIDSISHVIENGEAVSKVYSGKSCRTIPIKNISDISFESSTLDSGNAGEYQILELIVEDKSFKRAYVDNRANLIASKTGDFFANDTILMASKYHDFKCLLFTDSEGKITRYYDGENYLIQDYSDDDTFNLVEISKTAESDVALSSLDNTTTRVPIKTIWKNIHKFLRSEQFQNFIAAVESPVVETTLGTISTGLSSLSENLDIIANDPEQHSKRCITASLSLILTLGDLPAYLSSILSLAASDSIEDALFLDSLYGGIMSAFDDLLKSIYPDTDTIDRYRQFYANKYNLAIETAAATDVTSTSATLNGAIYSEDGIRGDVYFCISEMYSDNIQDVIASKRQEKVNQHELQGTATGLKPDTWYMYYVEYVCMIDKLKLIFTSEEAADFTTKRPTATTVEATNITRSSAIINCIFSNTEGSWCGVHYFSDDGLDTGVVSAGGDGEQQVTLTGLQPATTYTCYAVAKIGDKEYKGEEISFTTDIPDFSGTWNCQELHYNSAGEPYYVSYPITLYSDGSMEYIDQYGNFPYDEGEWGIDIRYKRLGIRALSASWDGRLHGKDWTGFIDNLKNPTKITGEVATWNEGPAGCIENSRYKFEMTR